MEDIKAETFLKQHVAGWYYVSECVHKVFYKTGHHPTPGPLPKLVKEATGELHCEEMQDALLEVSHRVLHDLWLNKNLQQVGILHQHKRVQKL